MLKTFLALTILAQTGTRKEAVEADRINAEVIKLYREGKYDEAIPLAKQVVELREKAFGGDDLAVANALNNLGNLYRRKGQNKEAGPVFERALAIAEKQNVADKDFAADLGMQVGLIRMEAGKYKEAEPYLRRVLEVKEKLHGAESLRLAPVLLNLADVSFLTGKQEQAYAFLGRALDILGRPPYRQDVETAKRLVNYYCPLASLGGEGSKELSERLGKVAWRLEKPAEAAEYEERQKEREERKARGELELVEGEVLNGRAVSKPQPEYPAAAKQHRVSGSVVVQIVVDESGRVVEASPVCGHPILAQASVEAARKARFTPTLLSGQPVKVSGIITYRFILQ